MNPKPVLGDVFEQLKSQASHTGQAVKQEPRKMLGNLMSESDEEMTDPQALQQQQQIARLRQLDEARKQEHLRALRQQQAALTRWDQERRAREVKQRQAVAQEEQAAAQEKQEKRQIKQLQRREKAEVLAVKRAQTQVEARLGKF